MVLGTAGIIKKRLIASRLSNSFEKVRAMKKEKPATLMRDEPLESNINPD